ncbi:MULTISPECIES: PadR family transcriptional regulator [Bacillota]|uniref:PadR family transcriptional regulator PadR n=1 Tax=Peptoniphilus gorbachii TaxID=411567 RepID=A0ABS2MIT2_9FIRM|nr:MULTISPECIES: PadR family transcriptional regulator [Bacillota]MBM7549866.1 PadR family transcriptional regulator PadR [Peptoniphilus gorbachii]MDU5096925.1 PadR family transcriptional regulator [Peptostreptococcus anaerobius]HEP4114319.1 PadR family transcriptional regulator [Streptococcus pyogenes]
MNEEWVSQIKRGTLEFVIMSLIQNKDRYGYDVIQTLDNYPMLKTKESTIYPLLRRLLKNGYLESYWQNMGEGIPARKYYKITELGISYLNQLNDDWEMLVQNINELRRG